MISLQETFESQRENFKYDRRFIGFISVILDGGNGTHPTCNIRTVKYDGCTYLRWSWINKARLQR